MCTQEFIQQKIADYQAAKALVGQLAPQLATAAASMTTALAALANCEQTGCAATLEGEGNAWCEGDTDDLQTVLVQLANANDEIDTAVESLSTFEDSGSVG